MRKLTLRLIAVCGMLAVCSFAAFAQGTKADYERANGLGRLVAGKVFTAGVRANWIGETGRFWYRNDLVGGKRAFVMVDPAAPSRKPAFDHARLAAGLSKLLGRSVEADRLPVETIAYVPDKPVLRVQAGGKTYECDLNTYQITPSQTALTETAGLALADAPRVSRSGGEETSLVFVNNTQGDVNILWIDTEGQRKPYGTLKAGEQRDLHTFAGHVWLVTNKENRPLGVWVAQALPDRAVIDGKTPLSRPRPNGRRRTGGNGATSPDGKWRVTVRDNNVVLAEAQSGQETPLTQDGTAQDAYEGQPVWSPDSSRFVLMKAAPEQEHKVYLVESSPKDQEQPKVHINQYLKPGDRIAHPRPHLFTVATKQNLTIKDDLFPNPWEINDVHWEADGKQFSFLYNQRGHQIMRLLAVNAADGSVKTLIDEQAKTFIDWTNKVYLHRLESTPEAVWMSERDGWNHLYLYDLTTGQVKNQITRGKWVVRGVERVDETKRQIWFRAGGVVSGQDPYYIHYCRVNFDGSGMVDLTPGDGTHTVVYAPDNKTLLDTYSRVDMPPVTELRSVADGQKLLDLERGEASALVATGWKYPERFAAKARDGVTDIYGVIVRPTNFDANKKYPVLENIYAGPQGSFVPKAFSPASGLQAMAELGFIVVQIDGMGTNNRSKAFHDVCWKNLSDGGFPDRILWMKAVGVTRPYMDLSRVGIYGTSAGGQNALAGLLLHPEFYKAGVADCGCHDNRMDKIWWNEQWMGWPVGPEYAANSNVTLAPRLQGKLLLMVGEMDTNVDPASTMQVVDALIKANKDFDLLVMPGQGHGVVISPYGRRREQDFFVRNLLHVEPRAN